mgnify:CR=1 FL=1
MFKRISTQVNRSKDENAATKDKKEEQEEVSEELSVSEELPCYVDDDDYVEIDVEWAKHFPKKRDRFSFYWWGDRVEVPEVFPPAKTLEIKQIAMGGRHYVALTSEYFHEAIVIQNNERELIATFRCWTCVYVGKWSVWTVRSWEYRKS